MWISLIGKVEKKGIPYNKVVTYKSALMEIFCWCQLYQEIKNVILYVIRQVQEVFYDSFKADSNKRIGKNTRR